MRRTAALLRVSARAREAELVPSPCGGWQRGEHGGGVRAFSWTLAARQPAGLELLEPAPFDRGGCSAAAPLLLLLLTRSSLSA